MSKLKTGSALLTALAAYGIWKTYRARTFPYFDLYGRNVLITGGSRGLGLVLARQFLKEGARVAVCARDAEELERAQFDLLRYGEHVFTYPCDIRDREQVRDMVEEVRRDLGSIEVLVNNAGVIEVGPMEVMDLEDFEEAMDTNYWGAVYVTLEVVPMMRARRSGRIANITSIGGKISVPHFLPYGASKFALVGFSEGLRAELAKDGIAVTTVCPGLMRTGSPLNADFKGKHRAEYAWFAASDSIPVLSISPERAARHIIRAVQRGDAELIYTLPARIGAAVHGLFPGLVTDLLAVANRFMPGPGGIGHRRMKGKQSKSLLSKAFNSVTESAARRNNEL